MSATPISSATPLFSSPYLTQQLRRYGPLTAVIGLHIAFFYVLQSGLLHHVVKAVIPKEVQVSLISEAPAPQPKLQPAEPKVVPVIKKQITRPTPTPVITQTPSPRAITEQTTPPQPSKEPPAEASLTPPAPAAPAQPAAAKTVSGLVYKNTPFPPYPRMDREMGIEGVVTLRVTVDEKGYPSKVDIEKSSGSAKIDESARDTVLRRWSFKPHLEDGKAVPAVGLVPINFTINR